MSSSGATSVSLCLGVCYISQFINHRGTEDTEVSPLRNFLLVKRRFPRELRLAVVHGARQWFHGHLLFAVSTTREGEKRRVLPQRIKHSINTRFHHLLRAYRLITLIAEEVTVQQR